MDYQNRAGNKGAGVAGASEANVDRRERLRKLAMETIDLNKDPYILRNNLGTLECRLCLTLHTNEGSYLAHTQGKKHQTNLARRAAKEAKDNAFHQQNTIGLIKGANAIEMTPKKHFIKIGRPGYKITKVREPILGQDDEEDDAEGGRTTSQQQQGGRSGLLFQIQLPEIKEGVKPLHRFMSSFEQRIEPPNRAWQYLVVAAEPYETISFKLQAKEVDRSERTIVSNVMGAKSRQEPGTWSHWDPDVKTYTIQVLFR
jgi:splicing factor 3A subunit 2